MSLKDLFGRLVNTSDDDYDETEEETTTSTELTSRASTDEYDELRAARSRRTSGESKVVDIRTTAMLQVVLLKPKSIDEARRIGEELINKRTVVLNFELLNKETVQRLIDFVNGVKFACGGTLKKVSDNIFIITPYDVNISGDLIDELENTGVFF